MKDITINKNIRKLIRENVKLAKQYNTYKNDVVHLSIKNVNDYRTMIRGGATKTDLYQTLIQERDMMKLPKTLVNLVNEINKMKEQSGRSERVGLGGIYSQYQKQSKLLGRKKAYYNIRSMLKETIEVLHDFAPYRSVLALVDSLKTAYKYYNANMPSVYGDSAFTLDEQRFFNRNLKRIENNLHTFPNSIIYEIKELSYGLKNATITPSEFTATLTPILDSYGVN